MSQNFTITITMNKDSYARNSVIIHKMIFASLFNDRLNNKQNLTKNFNFKDFGSSANAKELQTIKYNPPLLIFGCPTSGKSTTSEKLVKSEIIAKDVDELLKSVGLPINIELLQQEFVFLNGDAAVLFLHVPSLELLSMLSFLDYRVFIRSREDLKKECIKKGDEYYNECLNRGLETWNYDSFIENSCTVVLKEGEYITDVDILKILAKR